MSQQQLIASIPESWENPYNVECPCCLETPKQGRIILDCKHLICVPCFVKHINRSAECPICRVKMFHLPRPHTVARDTQTQRRVTRNTERIFEQEVNRRLQNHINEVNSIRAFVNQNRNTRQGQRRMTLRNAPPLRTGRNDNDDTDNNSHSDSDADENENNDNNQTQTHHASTRGIRNSYYTYFNNLDSILHIGGNRDTNHQQTSLSVQHCIIVTIFTAADILIMLLWLYTLNKKE